MRVIFEYPSELEASEVEKEFRKQQKNRLAFDNKVYLFIALAAGLLVFSIATTGLLSRLLFGFFIITIIIAYGLRHIPKKASKFNFVTAYDECIHIISYDTDLQSRTEATVAYQDIIKIKYKKGTFEMLIYETDRSSVIWYNSTGEGTPTTSFRCNVEPGSSFEDFLINVAPTLFL